MDERKNRICGIVSIVLAVLNGLGLIGFAISLLFQRPKFATIFSDFGATLPLLTRAVLAIPNGLIVFGTVLLLALLVGKEFIRRKTIPLVLNIAWIAAGIGISLLFAWAMMAPLAGTTEQM